MPEINFFLEAETNKLALTLLLMLPIVATIAGIARYIIGIKSLGIYAPVVLTFALYALGLTGENRDTSDIFIGIQLGIIFVFIMTVITIIISSIIKKSRMHYFPKISISLSVVALSMIIVLILGELFDIGGVNSVNALALILIASVAEQFTSIIFKKKLQTAILLTVETFITAIIGYLIIAWPGFKEFVLTYPYLVLLTILINYFVGRYRGLRIREYFRFKEILNLPEQSEK